MNNWNSLIKFSVSLRFLNLANLYLIFLTNNLLLINGFTVSGDRAEGRKLFGGYKITPKFCTPAKELPKKDPNIHGPTICMFNHECTQRQGEVVGACMDSFLFGTCCQLPGSIETPNMQLQSVGISSNLATAYEKFGGQQTNKDSLSKTPFGESNSLFGLEDGILGIQNKHGSLADSKFAVSNDAVMVSSPSSINVFSNGASSTMRPSTSKVDLLFDNSYEDSIYQSQYSTSVYNDIASAELSFLQNKNDLLSMESVSEESSIIPDATDIPDKMKYSKPIFKLKPVPTSTDKYVLVHTISNGQKPETETKQPFTSDSIQSIILMLNDTNPGPEYDIDNDVTGTSSHYYDSTASIMYGTSTKQPNRPTTLNVPSTSYVYSPNPTRRQTTSKTTASPKLPSSLKISNKPTKQSKPTTLNVPSTSYVYSPNPITKRPASNIQTTSIQPIKKIATTNLPSNKLTSTKSTLEKLKTKKPVDDEKIPIKVDNNNVIISGGGITKHPSPTVHITPKPVTNLLTTSTWNQLNQVTQQLNDNSVFVSHFTTQRPAFYSTSPGFISSSVYMPSIHDFQDEGYFVTGQPVTGRPTIEHTVTSTSIYTIIENPHVKPNIITAGFIPAVSSYTPAFDDSQVQLPAKNPVISTVIHDFPPVRNPHPNLTATSDATNESDIATPSFIEDEALDSKMDLLVSKIVASLQGNFDNLVDIVYDRKNVSTAELDIINLNKNGTINKVPLNSQTTNAPTKVSSAKPSSKPPQKITAKPSTAKPKPGNNSQTTKNPTKVSSTTKKPTKKPAQTTASGSVTSKKPPVKVTSTTKKPQTKTTKKTPKTTTPAIAEDEYDVVEESEDDNEIDAQIGDASASDKLKCGMRPQFKSGRIVGGKASAFGEFPWQVLVRESTWLGLFTKNKCGGVLISNSYVITAAHCQPGFLASLVAVFGEYDISGELEKRRSVTKNVKRVIVHRQYDAATFENDLAILELESPVRYDAHIIPICMPPDNSDYTGSIATVSGWGRLKYGGGVPSVLQEVQVPIIENNVCQEMFQTAGHSKKILPSFLCAGYANGQKDSCEGDSGGPLTLQREDGRFQLVGTVSHGIKCAAPYLPGVYMRTTYYKPWLKSITGVK